MIVAAAIRFDGKVWTGRRHVEIERDICAELGYAPAIPPYDYGFVDSGDNFYGRRQAAEIAYKLGQVRELYEELHSENLW